MNSSSHPPRNPSTPADPEPPTDLELLTGDGAAELVAGVFSAVGGEVLDWRVRHVDHRPAAGTTAGYRARVRWSGGAVTDEVLGACSGRLPAGVARLSDGRTEIGMWRYPHDPDLPALPAAADPERMRGIVAELGLRTEEPPRVRLRAYRPRRRAVFQVDVPGTTVFVKVVRPAAARGLHARHRAAVEAGCPVPDALGWTGDGMVLLAALPGRTLRARLTGTEPVDLDVDGVLGVLDALPAGLATTRRETWGQQAPHYAAVLAAAVPDLGPRARAVAAEVDHGTAPEGPDVPVHGDFYESQLVVDGGRVTGLLDIDTAGTGERLDDAACLLGHLDVLTYRHPARAGVISGLGAALQRRFEQRLDPLALRRRVAAVVLSLATGPHRVQEPDWRASTYHRVALAERWLAEMNGFSPARHGSLHPGRRS
ncbi:phosphotransferase family protein [Saccharopolyspora sp. CA-218241]|uniref:phosphotransferase family protein n=1 Tax=Saccharopolyspora sp. CA-218241 TaxID=3240027 RepID=UPI003D99C5A2